MKLVASCVLAIMAAACGDNNAYPDGTLFEGAVGTTIAVRDGYVYYGTYGEPGALHAIRRTPTGGGASEVLWLGGLHELIIGSRVIVAGDRVMWCELLGDFATVRLFSAPMTGGERVQLGERFRATGPVSDGTYVYVFTAGEIARLPIAGGTLDTIFTPPAATDQISALAFDGSTLYFTTVPTSATGEFVPATVWTLDGATARELGTIFNAMSNGDLAVDATHAYMATRDGIAKLQLATRGLSTLVVGNQRGFGVARTPDGIFGVIGTTADDETIVTPAETNLVPVAEHLQNVTALATDGADVYYVGARTAYASPYLAHVPL